MYKILSLLLCLTFPGSALGDNQNIPDIFHKAKALDLIVAVQNFDRIAQSDSTFSNLAKDALFMSDLTAVNSRLRASKLCNFYMENNGNPNSIEDCVSFWERDTFVNHDSLQWVKAVLDMRQKISNVVNAMVEAGYSAYWENTVNPQLDEYLDKYKIPNDRLDSIQTAFLDFAGPDSLSEAQSKIYVIDVSTAAFALPNESFCCSAILLNPEVQKQINLNFLSLFLHENLHRLSLSNELFERLNRLKEEDAFYAAGEDVAAKHNEGRNEAFVVAAECYLSNQLKIRTDAEVQQYFREYVDGALVLAPIIYRYLPEKRANQTFNDFLISLFDSGKIKAGEVERQYNEAITR